MKPNLPKFTGYNRAVLRGKFIAINNYLNNEEEEKGEEEEEKGKKEFK